MPSGPDAREPPLVRTANCVECHYEREHAICHVLHLLDDEWVIEHRPRGRVGARGQVDGVPPTEARALA